MDWLNLEVFLNPGSTLMEGIADKLGLPVDHVSVLKFRRYA